MVADYAKEKRRAARRESERGGIRRQQSTREVPRNRHKQKGPDWGEFCFPVLFSAMVEEAWLIAAALEWRVLF
jgi:hypothetical protein